jgi:hypothetical protein
MLVPKESGHLTSFGENKMHIQTVEPEIDNEMDT